MKNVDVIQIYINTYYTDLELRKVLQEVWKYVQNLSNRDAHEVLCSGDPEKPFITPCHVLYADKEDLQKTHRKMQAL